MKGPREVPGYVWMLVALVAGIGLGGFLPDQLAPVSDGVVELIAWIVRLVPILIVMALSPAIAGLVRRGRAGRFAGVVVGWYFATSVVAGLFGLSVSTLLFGVSLRGGAEEGLTRAGSMLSTLGQGGASVALLAIVLSVVVGLIGARSEAVYGTLSKVEEAISRAGPRLAGVLVPIVFLLGISVGVRFGARLGLANYLAMTAYTAFLCAVWWAFYVFVVLRILARQPVGRVLGVYYVPTAVFAAGTSSSLVTLPVNLANAKAYGVRDEVADFVLPFGAVMNLDASALAYVAYAPFVLSHVFGIEVSWTLLLAAWPAVVLFTIAAPGLPAGMGTALWSATLFASMVGLEEPASSEFVATWIALSSGIPDMLRTATNCTGDGFTAILMDSFFGESKRPDAPSEGDT
jgi:Na+/H+-dicarboxylate symporter